MKAETEQQRSARRRDYIRQWKASHRVHGPKQLATSKAKKRRGTVKRRQARCREIINATKLASGCVDCGYRAHAIALDFDHLPGCVKSDGVARLARVGSIERLLAEIAKCEVVCANCHRVRTLSRKGGTHPDQPQADSGTATSNPFGMTDDELLDCLGPSWRAMSDEQRRVYPRRDYHVLLTRRAS